MDQMQGLRQLYQLAGVEKLGGSWDEFVRDPHAVLEQVGQYDAMTAIRAGYRPLLPSQARLRQQLEAEWARQGHVVHQKTIKV